MGGIYYVGAVGLSGAASALEGVAFAGMWAGAPTALSVGALEASSASVAASTGLAVAGTTVIAAGAAFGAGYAVGTAIDRNGYNPFTAPAKTIGGYLGSYGFWW
jgi:hypothetical protein